MDATPAAPPAGRKPPEPDRYAFVDALRGWAILLVLLVHTKKYWFAPPDGALSTVAENGWAGVELFYVVSAFTLMLSLNSRRRTEARPLRNFFIRRLFRIAPLFYVAVAFFLLRDGLGPRFWAPDGLSWAHVLATVTFTNGWYPTAITSIVPGGWSIAIETNFYLLLPLCFLVVTSGHRAVALTFAAVVGGIVVSELAHGLYAPLLSDASSRVLSSFLYYMWLPIQAGVFCLGVVLYHLFRHIPEGPRRPLKGMTYVAIGLFLLFVAIPTQPFLVPKHFLFGAAFTAVAYGLALHPARLFVNPLLCHIGKVSYSIYLAHTAVIVALKAILKPVFPGTPGAASFWGAFLIATVAATLVATVTYHLVERPGIGLGRRWIAALEARARSSGGPDAPAAGSPG
jgi:peptidoglycan/LPS O-acetylase OafA/YrhL